MAKRFEKINTEIIYGIHPVLEGLKAGRRTFHEVCLAHEAPSKRVDRISKLAESKNIPLKKYDPQRLNHLAKTRHHQGVMAKVSPFPLTAITDLISRRKPDGETSFLILLDSIVDPHNLGAVIRTALAVDVDGIIIPKDRSVGPTPSVSKASAGMLEISRLGRVTNMVSTIRMLKEKGYWIYGLDATAPQSLYTVDFRLDIALIIGGEEKGIRPLIRSHCDLMLSIPQSGRVNSLNASVAAAVAIFEAFRQRSGHTTSSV